MFYILYGILYIISLFPLRVLYLLSDFAYLIIYYIIGYRKEVVMNNLAIAFPQKTTTEHRNIARKFYRNLTDTFIESIKMISIRPKELARRGHCDVDALNKLIKEGRNIHIMVGHQFNWEFANLMYARILKIPFVGIYMPVSNKIVDRIFVKSRSRYGSQLVSTREFRYKMHHTFKQQFVLALAADQNPGLPKKAFWLNFFGKPAPFVTGPGKGAVKNNTAVVYVAFTRKTRGHYSFKAIPLTENGADHSPEELTLLYKNALEESIRKDPSNYLWSHRRWRHEWQEGYREIIG
jgi:Kdo2-lipid IVA lauroyltransferase/acyltransferase